MTEEAFLVNNRSSPSIFGLYFPSSCSWNKAKLSVSSAWRPLNGGDNNGRTIVETPKRRLQPLNRGFIPILFYNYFGTLIIGRLMEVWLYSYPGDTIISVMAHLTARFCITKLSLEYRKHSLLLCSHFCVTSLTKHPQRRSLIVQFWIKN